MFNPSPFESFSNFDNIEFPHFNPMCGGNINTNKFSKPKVNIPVNTIIPCFKEDTEILCYINDVEIYVKVQDIRPGMRVKTLASGYIPVDMIGKKTLANPGDNSRIPNRIYKCSKTAYPDIIKDLYITGHHSILVEEISDLEREQIQDLYNGIYITEDKYRLPCFLDIKSEVVEKEESVIIYHIALENKDYYMNYGIYANGLLVETCSKRYLKELSNMDLII